MKKQLQRILFLLEENRFPTFPTFANDYDPKLQRSLIRTQGILAQERSKKRVEELAWLFVQRDNLKKKPQSKDRDDKLKEIEQKISKIDSDAKHYDHREYMPSIEFAKAKDEAARINRDINEPAYLSYDDKEKISNKYRALEKEELKKLDIDFPVGRDCSDRTLRPEAEQAARQVGIDVETVLKKLKAECDKQHKAETPQPSFFQKAKKAIGLEESLKLVIKHTIKQTLK